MATAMKETSSLNSLENDLQFISPFFLGAYAENNDVLEKLLVEFVRDHIYWRRNFHPEDKPPITASMTYDTNYLDSLAKIRKELHSLTARLKRSVPFFNPRYIGHMSSDLMMPGLLAQLITNFYNPNNITGESGAVTLDMELKVGGQFARMFGFSTDPDNYPCAWGHLTSGGTSANYESLWNFRAAKFFPLALVKGLKDCALDIGDNNIDYNDIFNLTPWQLMNFSIDEVLAMRRAVYIDIKKRLGEQALVELIDSIEARRIETLGPFQFFIDNAECKPPVVLVPATAHYSWERAMRVLGFGSSSLVRIPMTRNMRMDAQALDTKLRELLSQEVPVLAVIGVLGTTEFGTVDPVDQIVKIRDAQRKKGLEFYIHVDAAWGGYLTSIFREPNGELTDRQSIQSRLSYFPSKQVYDSFSALSHTDSVTIDPHKLGYLPFGTGGFVARNREIVNLLSAKAAYVFEQTDEPDFSQIGQYILEGSKPGANAAAAYVAHAVLPLDNQNFGRIMRQTVRSAEYFTDKLSQLKEKLRDIVHITVPIVPDSNLVTIALNPFGNDCVTTMNEFVKQVYNILAHDPDVPVQTKQYLGSKTVLNLQNLSTNDQDEVLLSLGFSIERREQHYNNKIMILRHTLMNPWLSADYSTETSSDFEGYNYLDGYCDFLEKTLSTVAHHKLTAI